MLSEEIKEMIRDELYSQFGLFSDEEIIEGRGAAFAKQMEDGYLYTKTEWTTGLEEGASTEEVNSVVQYVVETAVDRAEFFEDDLDAFYYFKNRYIL